MGKLVKLSNFCTEYKNKVNEIETWAQIGKPQLSGGMLEPYPKRLRAIWDTGAQGTSTSPAIAREIGLEQISEITLRGVTGECRSPVFLASLFLPNMVIIPEIQISECPGDIGCDILIGMDVISRGDFAISHKDGNTVFSFRTPSAEKIDFTNPHGYGASALNFVKIQRNAPCPCGSGKKYKKCCGAVQNSA